MTRRQRLAALTAGAILLAGIPVAGAHRAPPPDLGERVVVGRTGPTTEDEGSLPTSSSPPLDSRVTRHAPTRSPSPGTRTQPSDPDAVPPGLTRGEQEPDDAPDTAPSAGAQPVAPKSPVPAGVGSADDSTPTSSPRASAAAATPSPTGDDGGDDGDDDGSGGDD